MIFIDFLQFAPFSHFCAHLAQMPLGVTVSLPFLGSGTQISRNFSESSKIHIKVNFYVNLVKIHEIYDFE